MDQIIMPFIWLTLNYHIFMANISQVEFATDTRVTLLFEPACKTQN